MGDNQDGAPLLRVEHGEGLGELGEAPQINPRLGLVKDHQLGVPGQNAGDLNPLDLAAGEGGIHVPVHIVVGAQAHLIQVVTALLPGQPLAGGDLQQIPHLQSLEPGRLLEPIGDTKLGPLGNGQASDIGSVPENLARSGLDNAHHRLGKGGLAAAVGAGDHYKFILIHSQVNVV